MRWNWQQPDWPRFSWSVSRIVKAEERFLLRGGVLVGSIRHLDDESQDHLRVAAMSSEALTTSAIEGEVLDRASVQSSVRRQLGLSTTEDATPAEQGIAEMVVDLHREPTSQLDNATLFSWHRMVMRGRSDIDDVGCFRTHTEPMQIVSGKIHDPTLHFEAPPSTRVKAEMSRFLDWFNRTSPDGSEPLPALTRAATAHLCFVSIHPFQDGNGRIARAISEKALAQSLGVSALTSLAPTILARRAHYYRMLEASNKRNEITAWLAWFAAITLEAQERTHAQVAFLIDKTKLFDRMRNRTNKRQHRVLIRVLEAGPTGFKGGLSAGNYASIAKTSPATATRDLADLVQKGALARTGERRHARYHPAIPLCPTPRIIIDEAGRVIESAE